MFFQVLNFKNTLQRGAIPEDSISHSFSGVASVEEATKMLIFSLPFSSNDITDLNTCWEVFYCLNQSFLSTCKKTEINILYACP